MLAPRLYEPFPKRTKRLDDLRRALAQDDDQSIVNTYTLYYVEGSIKLTPADSQRIELAQKRVDALRGLRSAMETDHDEPRV